MGVKSFKEKSTKPYYKQKKDGSWEKVTPDPNVKEFFHLRGHALSAPIGKGSK